MKNVRYHFSWICIFLEKMTMWFNYPRRPYSILVAPHPYKEKYVVFGLCNAQHKDFENVKIVDYALLPLSEARELSEKIKIIADQIEVFGG